MCNPGQHSHFQKYLARSPVAAPAKADPVVVQKTPEGNYQPTPLSLTRPRSLFQRGG